MRFFVDNNISHRVARALHCLVEPRHSVTHLKDRFPPDTSDVDWMNALAAEADWIILSADTAISRNPHEIEAWKRAGHPIFFFKHSWLQQRLWEQASRLFYLFPEILKYAEKAQAGDSYLVPFKKNPSTGYSVSSEGGAHQRPARPCPLNSKCLVAAVSRHGKHTGCL